MTNTPSTITLKLPIYTKLNHVEVPLGFVDVEVPLTFTPVDQAEGAMVSSRQPYPTPPATPPSFPVALPVMVDAVQQIATTPPVVEGNTVAETPHYVQESAETGQDPWSAPPAEEPKIAPPAEPEKPARRRRRTAAQIAADKAAEEAAKAGEVPEGIVTTAPEAPAPAPVQPVFQEPVPAPAVAAAPQFIQVGVDGSGNPVYSQVMTPPSAVQAPAAAPPAQPETIKPPF